MFLSDFTKKSNHPQLVWINVRLFSRREVASIVARSSTQLFNASSLFKENSYRTPFVKVGLSTLSFVHLIISICVRSADSKKRNGSWINIDVKGGSIKGRKLTLLNTFSVEDSRHSFFSYYTFHSRYSYHLSYRFNSKIY